MREPNKQKSFEITEELIDQSQQMIDSFEDEDLVSAQLLKLVDSPSLIFLGFERG